MGQQGGSDPSLNAEWECSPRQAHAMLQSVEAGVVLVDCRTEEEWDQARIEGAILIPLAELHERAEELRHFEGRPIVVYCHHGRRSLRATAILRDSGFPTAISMAGGIDRWSVEIDPSVPRYSK